MLTASNPLKVLLSSFFELLRNISKMFGMPAFFKKLIGGTVIHMDSVLMLIAHLC